MRGPTEPEAAAGPVDDAALEALVAEAWAASTRAYAPYSGFAVGAAVATDAGVFGGANVENASYPVGLCAERAAMAAAATAGARRLRAVAVATPTRELTPPCGMCRQFLWEFAVGADPVVVLVGEGGARRSWHLSELLPEAFGPSSLGR